MLDTKITAVIITYNEEKYIQACLNSLRGVADEIIVIDSFSEDNTPRICRSNPFVFFVQREWCGYAATKNYGNALANHPYILSIDADEILSDELRGNIMEEKMWLRGAYSFKRRNHIGARVVKYCGWYPDEKVRLFPKHTSTWAGDYVHEELVTNEQVRSINGDLLHYSYSGFDDLERRFRKYAELGAISLFKQKKKVSVTIVFLKSYIKFLKIFVLKLGFLEGYCGYKIALESFKSTLHKYKLLHDLYSQSEDPAYVPPQYLLRKSKEKIPL